MLIDLSHNIKNKLQVFPGDEQPLLEKAKEYSSDGYTNYKISIGVHTGTHIDGPMHLSSSKVFLSSFPIEMFIGPGHILNVAGESTIKWKDEYSPLIEGKKILLFYTGFEKYFGTEKYLLDNPVIDKGLAEELIKHKIKMIGIDLMSPDQAPFPIHKLLLSHNILIAENLTNLSKVLNIKKFEVIALPVKTESDSAPARIIAREY